MDGFSQGVKGLLQDCKAETFDARCLTTSNVSQPLMSRNLITALYDGVIHAPYYWWGNKG